MESKTLFGPCRQEITECLKCGVPHCSEDTTKTDLAESTSPYVSDGQHEVPFVCDDASFLNLSTVTGLYLKNLETLLKSNYLDLPQWQILVLLGDGSIRSITDLANKTAGKNSATTRIVQRMEKDGLVSVNPSAKDARYKDVQLTQKGECARLLAFKSGHEILKTALKNVSPKEFRTFSSIAQKMANNLT